jgi:hypothetical protein
MKELIPELRVVSLSSIIGWEQEFKREKGLNMDTESWLGTRYSSYSKSLWNYRGTGLKLCTAKSAQIKYRIVFYAVFMVQIRPLSLIRFPAHDNFSRRLLCNTITSEN